MVAKRAVPGVRLDVDGLLERDKICLMDHAAFLLHPRYRRLLPTAGHAHNPIGPTPSKNGVHYPAELLDRVTC